MSKKFRIVLIGPDGERDYLEKISDGGIPIVGGDAVEFAGTYPKTCAKRMAETIRRHWLSPHVDIDLEEVAS